MDWKNDLMYVWIEKMTWCMYGLKKWLDVCMDWKIDLMYVWIEKMAGKEAKEILTGM